MKKLHLVSASHIDPAWLWDWREGAAAALSTFRCAADFCDEYEGYVFCHNESLLYQWVEEHEPELFERIQKLVKAGKWHIMGGWYNQPDCAHLSGESFIRQARAGLTYFEEKFGVRPRTALNFDTFGHTRGLVQILKKCGFDSYIFMRPLGMKPGPFIWRGFDGSEVIGHKTHGSYGNLLGEAANKIREFLNKDDTARGNLLGVTEEDLKALGNGDTDVDSAMIIWGVGDHGGGASRKDLDDIARLSEEYDVEIIHSTPDAFFSELSKEGLPVIDRSLTHCMIGCYTTMVRIKQKHRQLEGLLTRCDKMLAHSGVTYDPALLQKAEEAIMFNEFHDILPGTCVKRAEDDALASFGLAEEIIERATIKAFFALCGGQKVAEGKDIPILVYNPHPYPVETEVEAEFQLANQNWGMQESTMAKVYDENGDLLPCQHEKEASTMNLDWRKKVVFRATLKPMAMNRFDCRLTVEQNCQRDDVFTIHRAPFAETADEISFDSDRLSFAVSKKTGLITRYVVNGKSLLTPGAGEIGVFADYEDPWGMHEELAYTDKVGSFRLLSDAEANAFRGYPDENYPCVNVIENGDVRMKIQAIFAYGNSHVVATYTVNKHDVYVDLDYEFFTADGCKMFKLQLPTPFTGSKFLGQTAFGTEENIQAHKEVVFQKWCGLAAGSDGLAVLTRGIGGGSADGGELRLSLLHTPVHSAHPLGEGRPVATHDRMNSYIDMGQRQFSLRLMPYSDTLDARAEQFNEPVYALSFFPSGNGEKKPDIFRINNERIVLSALRREKDGILIRLYHGGEGRQNAVATVYGRDFPITFGTYEVKTFLYKDGVLTETDMLGKSL